MACFLIPAGEAVITTITQKIIEHKESSAGKTTEEVSEKSVKMPFSAKIKWLNGMLWGGSALLAFEHIWHGEIIPVFPFLTNAANPEDAAAMLHEMGTAGVAMAALVTAVWGAMVGISHIIEKRSEKSDNDAEVEIK